ncbi:MAG TPA: CotH kinase family protein, partial [Methylomirabilota bacterium]|nr:CotH kinase family protein [Methylomirabilota bacterium]
RLWNNASEYNLNSRYSYLQVFGSSLATKAGMPAAQHRAVQLRVNGVNYGVPGAYSFPESITYGSYALQESMNGDWADRMFPDDGDGNIYRCARPDTGLDYLGTNPNSYVATGYSKESNTSENDWTDLINLTAVLNSPSDAGYAQRVRQVVNIDKWMAYFAACQLMENSETALCNGANGQGVGDDYSMYRGVNDPRFILMGHDFDTIFNLGDGGGNPNEDIFQMNAIDTIARFMQHPEITPVYYRTLKHLAETVFAPEQFDPFLDSVLGSYVPATTLDGMKAFNAQRRNYVLSRIPLALTLNVGLPVVNGYYQASTPTVTFSGSANVIETYSVRVNGAPAQWVPWQRTWTINNLALQPGVNTVTVQTFDQQARELERASVAIWYDDGSVVTVSGNVATTTWTAAGGPYLVSGDLTIPAGATLTIEAGTTVYLGAGVNIIVANGGRLVAEGTDTRRIRFTRPPGSAGSWGGINVNGSAGSPETRIAYAHFEFNDDTAIHVTDGTVFLDHLTFGNPARQYVSLDRASFVVQHCHFPAITGSFEPVHGSGGIKAGGRGIFRRNFWGRVRGYNDALDFTGGNRPGPILQVLDNVFMGSDDDLLDLDSTDAWVEGNIFLHVHRNGSPDSASAVSGGADNADTSQITILRNLFYDVDQAANAKQGNFYTMLHNTIVEQTIAGSQDPEGGVVILADEGTAEGAGIYLEGNIISGAENLVRNRTAALVTFSNNIIHALTGAPWTGPGGGNSTDDPLFTYLPTPAETTNFANWTQAQVMWEWFSLQTGSPAVG